jgi:hypothetical protein
MENINTNVPKFQVGQTVLYINGDEYELGIIKELVPTNDAYKYRVWYHTGDTTAVTDECLLHEIKNEYAFRVIRKSANPMDFNLSDSRKLATKIVDIFEFYGNAYYEVEDWVTACIEGYHSDVPNIDYEYLKCAVAVEVRDYLNRSGINYNDHTIRECVDACFDCYENSVLNTEFIQETVARYIANRPDDWDLGEFR